MSSPTKEIREALGDLSLSQALRNSNSSSSAANINNGTEHKHTSIKNHFQIPKLVVNAEFDKENHMDTTKDSLVQQLDFGDDTVVHNKDTLDTTMPEWLKVKLEMEEKKMKEKAAEKKHVSSFPKPHLVRSYISGSTAAENQDTYDDGNNSQIDTTWEQMKKSYNINNTDVYGDVTRLSKIDGGDESDDNAHDDNVNHHLRAGRHHNDDEIAMNNTAYSFQDTNSFKITSDEVHSLGTAKVTSYRTEFLDSPMPRPKLIKTFEDALPPLKRPQLKTELQEIELITPMDEGMVYDSAKNKWVYPLHGGASKVDYGYELVFDDDSNVSVSQSRINSTTTVDPRQVTNVSRLDLSFSESRKALVAALQDVLKSRENWDKVTKVDLSGKSLLTVKSLEEFVPNVKDLNLNDNSLTSLEGLSELLQSVLLSHNSISDQFLSFDKYQNMQHLDLSHNDITKLTLFAKLDNLRSLNLSGCNVNELCSLPSLMKLDLSHNKISGVVDLGSLKMSNMQELNLSGNTIKEVKNMNYKELRVLNLESNELEAFEVTKSLPRMKKLLLAGNNKLARLELGSLMKQLRFISIAGGTTKIVAKCPELLTLCLYQSDKKLTVLKDEGFIISPYLQEIVLRSCQLEFEDLKLLIEKFPHLRKFDVRDNQVGCSYKDLVEFFMQFGKVSQVRLEENPVVEQLKDKELMKAYELMMYKLTHQ